jgi:hypothetical protein
VPWRKGDFWSPREVPTCPNTRDSSTVEEGGAESGERSEVAIERERERDFRSFGFSLQRCVDGCALCIESANSPWVNGLIPPTAHGLMGLFSQQPMG